MELAPPWVRSGCPACVTGATRPPRTLPAFGQCRGFGRASSLGTAVLERIESLVLEMMQRVDALRTQIESSAAEALQRESQNQELCHQAGGFRRAKRDACETRESLLQFESEQVRARLAEIDRALHTRPPIAGPVAGPSRRAFRGLPRSAIRRSIHGRSCMNELVERQELIGGRHDSDCPRRTIGDRKITFIATCAPALMPWGRST